MGMRLRRVVFLALVCAGTAWAFRASHAEPTGLSQSGSSLEKVVSKGIQFERSRQWIDAIEHYEREIKKHPQSDELTYGLRRSKIHFGIERRYSDSSFLQKMLTLNRQEALQLVDEVLTKVQSNYVESLSTTSFIAHGTESLYLALANHKYLSTNILEPPQQPLQRVRETLKTVYWNKPIEHRQAAFQTINMVCDLAQRELNLAPGAVVMEYLFGGCNALDDYSCYLTPHRLNDLYGNIEGQFVGLGIEMKGEMGKGLLLVNVLPDSPAAEGGLLAGEHITMIDGVNCKLMTTDEAANMLQGLPGSRVKLQVADRVNKSREVSFQRRAVNVRSIPVVRIIDRQQGIGYIKMTGFQKTSATEMDLALSQLQSQGMRSLIWDLRGNPGGLLTAAVEVLDRFIPQGVIVSTKGRTADQNWTYSAHHPGTLENLPLVVLIDGDSASASEIVAGAVKDHQRGTLVGRKTYGKWSVQSIFTLRNSAGLRLTTAKFYSPNGHTLGKIGVHPDAAVTESSAERHFFRAPTDINVAEDLDIQKGLRVLRGQDQQVAQP